MARIIILGAGLTGLSTAYHLEQTGCSDYLLFEKEDCPGGLCRSVTVNGFTFDYTGHLLHSNDTQTRPLVEHCIGVENLATIKRSAWIESTGITTPYPFQLYLHGRSPDMIAECIEAFVTRTKHHRPTRYTDWVESAFGKGFGKHFFYPYQRKIFAYPPRKLTSTWTGRFVPKTDLSAIIRNTLSLNAQENVGYNATFLYPKAGGIQTLITGLAQQLRQPIITGMCATAIDTKRKVVTFTNGHQEPYEQLVSTLPLATLLSLLENTRTKTLQTAARNLLCTRVLNINLGVAEPLPEASWLYYPDKTIPWYRVGFPHTFSKTSCPPGMSSLYAEVSCLNTHSFSIKKIQTIEEQLLKHLGITKKDVVARAPLILDHAYVIYNQWRDKNVPRILKRLTHDYAIHSIGRYGEWKYASMQEALTDGKTLAHQLTTTYLPAHPVRRCHEAPSTHPTHSTNQHPAEQYGTGQTTTHPNGDEHEV